MNVFTGLVRHAHALKPGQDLRAPEPVDGDAAEVRVDVVLEEAAVAEAGARFDAADAGNVFGDDVAHPWGRGSEVGCRLGREREGLAVGVEEVLQHLRSRRIIEGLRALLARLGVAPQNLVTGRSIGPGLVLDAGHRPE
ncbi:hypothetical protein ACX80U_12285 [Arthrobacter sp. TmT3-37]